MESSNNIAQYLFKNQKETIKASLIEFFKRNNLYATSEKYDHPEENNFSFNLYANIITFKCFRTVKEHIDLDVLIEITIEVTNLVDGELETKIYSDYYTLSINAILNNGIHDLNVYDIKYGSHVRAFDYRTSLNEFLVPYIRVQDYEVYAHQFLELYYPEALEKPMAVNPLILLERMGLSIYVARLDSEVNGKIVYSYNPPRAGEAHAVEVGLPVPNGSRFVAYAHIHPTTNDFTPQDINLANRLHKDAYVIGPNQNLIGYNNQFNKRRDLGYVRVKELTDNQRAVLWAEYGGVWDEHADICSACNELR